MPNLQFFLNIKMQMQKIKTVFLNVSLILPSVMITIMVMMIIITIIIKPDNKTVTSTNEHKKNMWESLDIIQRETGAKVNYSPDDCLFFDYSDS